MNHPGEIALLSGITAPTVALVNNAQREHQEFMATVEAAARENGASIEALDAQGTVVIPADDDYTPLWRQLAGARRVLSFALRAAADVVADTLGRLATGRCACTRRPATLRSSCTWPACTTSRTRWRRPPRRWPSACRWTPSRGAGGLRAGDRPLQAAPPRRRGAALTLVDDSYNANPDSVRAAIDVLAALNGPRWLLLGDMGEVGTQGPAFHAEVGDYARQRGIEQLWTVGEQCVHAAACLRHGGTALRQCRRDARGPAQRRAVAAALVKGSKFMRMPRVVQALLQESQHAA